MTPIGWKWRVVALFFGRWRRHSRPVEGYTILLPSPVDMPFLLRFALDGLRHLDTSHCRQIIVIPDGLGADRAAALRQVVDSCGDSRVELARLRPAAQFMVHGMRRSGGGIANWTHCAMIIEGINRAKCDYIFLHDADAFLLESEGLERQYRECCDRGMSTLGVMARWDPFFREIGYVIPGTYELMFSAHWVRRHRPVDLKGRTRETTHGLRGFDTMLYPQFQDYASGKVGILEPPMRLVHFNGAITIYREFRDRVGQPVNDDLFRMLFLALMEDLIPSPSGDRVLPSVSELARGLDDPSAAITYSSPRATRNYPTFRAMVNDLCSSPVFRGARAEQIRASIYPFDRHYENLLGESKTAAGGSVIELDGLDGSELAGKRLQLLTEIIPRLARLAVLSNPSNPSHGPAVEQMQAATTSQDVELHVARARSPDEFESAFATVIAGRADALIVLADEMLFNNHPRILLFTDFNRLPALFADREVAEAGGLMAYGPSSLIHQCADAAESSAELATRFEFAINLRTAAALGLAVPPTLLALADTVTE
jgi:hypothetical protein